MSPMINPMKQKLSSHDAAALLTEQLAQVTDARVLVRPESDDSGAHIALYIECRVPASRLPPLVQEILTTWKDHHWRLVAIKVPYGWVEVMEASVGSY